MKRPKLEIIETQDIQKIITAAYDLLENFGVMAQLINPGTPVLCGGGAIVLDMRH